MTFSEQCLWLTWSSVFLVPWIALYVVFPVQRRVMRWTSLFTMPFGLTEPLFVPEVLELGEPIHPGAHDGI